MPVPPESCTEAAIRLGLAALGTRVEIVLLGDDRQSLQASGEAALAEVAWWHAKLSRFATDSDLAFIAREAHCRPVRLDPDLFDLLAMCEAVRVATGGAFDVRVAEAMDVVRSGDDRTKPRNVAPEMIFDAAQCTLYAPGPTPLRLDLGGVGKGFALDRAMAVLREAGVTNALIHAGTSSIAAIGPGPAGEGWRVRVADETAVGPTSDSSPLHAEAEALRSLGSNLTQRGLHAGLESDNAFEFDAPLDITLHDEAMSVSVPTGRWCATNTAAQAAHILDPRTGTLVASPRTAVVIAPISEDAGARCEAWSTSLAVLGMCASPPADLTTFLREPGNAWRERGRTREETL